MKKFVSIMLLMSVFFTIFASVGQAAAAVVPKLFLNGQLLSSSVNPQITNKRVIVPVRVISESLGFEVKWDDVNRTVTINSGLDVIKLKINDSVAIVNGKPIQMDAPATILKGTGTTIVPIRFVGEQFGLKFEWKDVEKEVHMYQEPTDPVIPPDPVIPTPPAGVITAVGYDGVDTISINYDGVVKSSKPFYLDNRIVFDFTETGFSSELSALFIDGQVSTTVTENTYLERYRYSLFKDAPPTARLVLEAAKDTGYVVTESEGLIQIKLMPINEVPIDPSLPVDPVIPPVGDKVFNIVIDAGHGGSDPGAKSILNKWEKEFTLSIVLKMKALLEKETKIKAHFTRTGDTYPSLGDRVALAEKLKADLFVSIHGNSAASSVTGAETYYYSANSKAFAQVIHKRLIAATGIKDRGVKTAAYKVIKETTMPAVLLEAGFLTNTSDAKMLYDDASQNRIAKELVAGIKEYLKVN